MMDGCHDVDKFLRFGSLAKNRIEDENNEINFDNVSTVKEALKSLNKNSNPDAPASAQNVYDMPKSFIDLVKYKLEYNDFWYLADCIIKGDFQTYSTLEKETINDIKKYHPDKTLNESQIKRELTKGLIGYCVDHKTRANPVMFLSSQQCKTNDDNTVTHSYCEHMKMLLENLSSEDRYALVTAEYGKTKFTSLHYAALMGSPCSLLVLLSNGANVNVYDNMDAPPLKYALVRKNVSFLKVLLMFGCNIADYIETCINNFSYSRYEQKIRQRISLLKNRLSNTKYVFKGWCEQYIKDLTVIDVISNVYITRGALYPGGNIAYPEASTYFAQTQIVRVDMKFVNGNNQDRLENGLFPVIIMIPFNFNEKELGGCISEFHATKVKFVSDNRRDKKEKIAKYIIDNLKMEGTYATSNGYPVLPLTIEPPHNGYFYMFRIPDNVIHINQLKFKYEIRDIKNPQYLNLAIGLVLLQKIR
ncbi:Ankyrin repeat and Ankyrin repeat-containing domain-containing protein [Strongyloides ratti]|uniref:Ankyrin repeat and Ankyrin repeat-containing domain-containing protein n=1 Tax=Strongyloides ratti TaxID=34506 RepID=A0A090KY25_STRRB|nr:Ankyrin repeat and Ankyrin repeat-containing domain-containing protein [Strongyloides ratti]CEF62420.1 Ankyrin repeat and Ankyrin repeat-containing domain-containing protein [Strongyloides ratti]